MTSATRTYPVRQAMAEPSRSRGSERNGPDLYRSTSRARSDEPAGLRGIEACRAQGVARGFGGCHRQPQHPHPRLGQGPRRHRDQIAKLQVVTLRTRTSRRTGRRRTSPFSISGRASSTSSPRARRVAARNDPGLRRYPHQHPGASAGSPSASAPAKSSTCSRPKAWWPRSPRRCW